MKNIRHTFRAWLVCMLALFAALPASADVTPDQLEFTEVEGGYSVTQKSGATLTGTLVIPETYDGKPVVEIGEIAFSNCKGLTSATIPDGVKTIGYYAFKACTGLTGVVIPDGLTTIGDHAFDGCTGLTGVHLGKAVDTIGDYAFYTCSGLVSLTIPEHVTSIGGYAFSHCTNLVSINVDEGNTSYKSVDGVLYNKDITQLIAYPAGKTGTSFTIPQTVASLGADAFAASRLNTVTLPAGIADIGDWAFSDCAALGQITCCATTPPELSQMYPFGFDAPRVYEAVTLCVPDESVDAYRRHEGWGKFQNIVGKDLTGIGAVETDASEAGAVEIYGLDGVRHPEGIKKLRPGNYVVRQGGRSRKIHVRQVR